MTLTRVYHVGTSPQFSHYLYEAVLHFTNEENKMEKIQCFKSDDPQMIDFVFKDKKNPHS